MCKINPRISLNDKERRLYDARLKMLRDDEGGFSGFWDGEDLIRNLRSKASGRDHFFYK